MDATGNMPKTSGEKASTAAIVVRSIEELRRRVAAARRQGNSIGAVPTMGALHAGHLSLVQACRKDCGFTVVTIFVNPTQFGPSEDFSRYPRTLEADMAALAPLGVDLVFVPTVETMYPSGFAASLDVGPVARPLEGAFRSGHFAGVATVVLKLFNQVQPDVAYFGRKDFQQSVVIRQLVRDLDLPVEIRVCPTVREADGLALSSRNAYLAAEERQQATVLYRSLQLAKKMAADGERDAAKIHAAATALFSAAPLTRLQYFAVVDPDTMQERTTLDAPSVALIAAHVGNTRLIDNEILLQ